MTLSGVAAFFPKDWRAALVVAAAAIGGSWIAQARAEQFVEERVAPIRKKAQLDHAIIRHMFEHIEHDAVLHGQKAPHTMKEVNKEAAEAELSDEDE